MADEDEFNVSIQRNSAAGGGAIALNVNKSMSMKAFKKLAGKRLGIKVKRVFLSSGSELSGVDEMQNDDLLFISAGEPFYRLSGGGGGGADGAAAKTLHVSVLGTGGVGKSALTLRFVRGFFVKDWDPTIEDAYRKNVEVDDKFWMLEILDTAGQDDFESLRPQWMMEKDGYIFVYSMDKRVSLEELTPFYELHEQINETRQIPIVLVANKKDMFDGSTDDGDPSKREVSEQQGLEQAAEWGATYVETSACTGENVDEVFNTFIRLCNREPDVVVRPKWWEKCVLL